MDGVVEQWINGTGANLTEIDEVNRNSTKSKQEVRFLLLSSIFPILHYSIDSSKLSLLIFRLIHCFLH